MKKKKMIQDNVRICFIGDLSSTFIKSDYEILKKHFEVDVIEPPKKKTGWFMYAIGVAKKVRRSNLTFSWFAGWHSAFAVFFSELFRKTSIVIVGGYDAAYVPEISYGAFTNLKEKIPAKFVLKNADIVISISKSNQKELLEKVKPKKNILIYNGVPLEKSKPSGEKEDNLVITVGGIKQSNLKRKGIELFVRTAKLIPGARFVIIGRFIDDSIGYLRSIASDNVEFTGFVPDEELLKWYQRAKVYVQASAHEGFGIAVAEAMLCECIPVVTERFALPEVVSDTGFYVPYGDDKATAEAILKSLNSPDDLGKKARERIKEMFSMEKREKALLNVIENDAKSNKHI